jgi:hypothetical protein
MITSYTTKCDLTRLPAVGLNLQAIDLMQLFRR